MGSVERIAHPHWDGAADTLTAGYGSLRDRLTAAVNTAPAFDMPDDNELPPDNSNHDAFYVLLPLLIVLSTFLFLLLIFLLCIILLRRRRGIMLRDSDGPIDMSREDLIEGEGGFEGVESRWLETVPDGERRAYARAKGML